MGHPRQAELPLQRGTRGGWRPGAGRKPGARPRVRHTARPEFAGHFPCHVTLKALPGLPPLRNAGVVRAVIETFRAGAARSAFRLLEFSIQDDHLHAIVEADGPAALGRGMKSLAARFAKAVNRGLKRRGPVLRDRYHLHVLRTVREVRNGDPVRAEQRAAALQPGRTRAGAWGAGGPGVVGRVVPRLAAGGCAPARDRATAGGLRHELARTRGMAEARAARSGGDLTRRARSHGAPPRPPPNQPSYS